MLFFVKQNSRKATEKKLPTLPLRSFCYCNLISKTINSNLRFSNNSVRFSCCNFSCLQIKWCCAFLTKISLHNKYFTTLKRGKRKKKTPDLIKIPHSLNSGKNGINNIANAVPFFPSNKQSNVLKEF